MNNRHVDEIIIYKADGTPVEVTQDVTSFSMSKGDPWLANDGYADTPITSAEITIKNTNDRQYANHFTKGKIVYENNYIFLGDGNRVYDNPIPYLKDVRVKDNPLLTVSYSEGKLRFSEAITGNVTLLIARHDITTNNPLNYIGNDFIPLLRAGAQITWKRNYFTQSFHRKFIYGNGTNTAQFYISEKENVTDIQIIKAVVTSGMLTFYEEKESTLYTSKERLFYETKKLAGEEVIPLQIVSWNIVGDYIEVTFNQTITDETVVILAVEKLYNQKTLFFLDGVIGEDISSRINDVSISIKDKSYFLQQKLINTDTFRRYHTLKDELEVIHILEAEQNGVNVTVGVTDSTITGIKTNFTKYSIGQEIYIFNSQDYYKVTIATITDDENMTINEFENFETGVFNIYAEVINTLENHITKCLEDTADSITGSFNLVVENPSNWRVIPKVQDQQYNSIWDYIQGVNTPRGMFLGFKFQELTDTHELTLLELPQTVGESKYTITEDNILDSYTYENTSTRIRTSWILKYYDADLEKVNTYVNDDFIQSIHNVTVLQNKSKIVTDELLTIGNYIRIDNEYRIIKSQEDSQNYTVSVPFTKSQTTTLYTQGEYTNKYGLRKAEIELNNTSGVDTVSEALDFTERLKNQYKEVYETHRITVRLDDFNELDNFDTITIDSPRLSIFNEKVFVTNLEIQRSNDWYVTFTVSRQMDIGEYRYNRIITEKGINSITKDDNMNTGDIFEPVTGLIALDPAVDNANGYSVYTVVRWNNYLDKAVSWEIEYKKQSELWEDSVSKTPSRNEEKIFLTEQSIFDIRVRGVSKTGVKGNWAYTTVDSSKYFIENPFLNKIWYINLFEGNDIKEYFEAFDKLNYTENDINDLIDTIEIVPNKVTFNNEIVLINRVSQVPLVIEGLMEELRIRLTSAFLSNKDLRLRKIENGHYSIKNQSLVLNTINNFEGVTSDVLIKGDTTNIGFNNFGDTRKKYFRNLTLEDFSFCFVGGGSVFQTNQTTVENLFIKNCSVGIDGVSKVYNCYIKDVTTGITECFEVENNVIDACNFGITNSRGLKNNRVYNVYQESGFGQKYLLCYSSISDNATNLIADNGSDTSDGGFNT